MQIYLSTFKGDAQRHPLHSFQRVEFRENITKGTSTSIKMCRISSTIFGLKNEGD
jgi:hypothetical protein